MTTVRTTCPRDCYDACGVARRPAERPHHAVRGDPDHPVSRGPRCAGSARSATTARSSTRPRGCSRPCVRSGPKGAGAFRDVSLGRGARRWSPSGSARSSRRPAPRGDPQHPLHGHVRAARLRLPAAVLQPPRRDRGRPRHRLQQGGPRRARLPLRHVGVGFDPRTAARRRLHPRVGREPVGLARRTPTSTGWRRRPARSIVVDPIRTGTAAQADLHLQPFPGSRRRARVRAPARDPRATGSPTARSWPRTALGWRRARAAARRPCTPEWGERTTGVPAADIERAAHLYARGPVAAVARAGAAAPADGRQRHARVSRCCPPLTGNLGRRGAGFLYLNGDGRAGSTATS